ncbi:MAG: hypothetical protein M1838_003448 [Thelocarpon superellum]|nr:MAG: hypothetical protein M1838_003448 [Thelocarpon superellum]
MARHVHSGARDRMELPTRLNEALNSSAHDRDFTPKQIRHRVRYLLKSRPVFRAALVRHKPPRLTRRLRVTFQREDIRKRAGKKPVPTRGKHAADGGGIGIGHNAGNGDGREFPEEQRRYDTETMASLVDSAWGGADSDDGDDNAAGGAQNGAASGWNGVNANTSSPTTATILDTPWGGADDTDNEDDDEGERSGTQKGVASGVHVVSTDSSGTSTMAIPSLDGNEDTDSSAVSTALATPTLPHQARPDRNRSRSRSAALALHYSDAVALQRSAALALSQLSLEWSSPTEPRISASAQARTSKVPGITITAPEETGIGTQVLLHAPPTMILEVPDGGVRDADSE